MVQTPQVRLIVPSESRYVRIARLTAAAVGTDAGFDVEDVEDVRIAVNELFALLIEGAEDSSATVELSFATANGSLDVEGRRQGAHAIDGPEDLAREILAVVVDEHHFDHDGDARHFRLRKHVPGAP